MRIFLLLLAVFPVVAAFAQINKSATEFAKEKVGEYVVNNLSKEKTYKPVSYGELKEISRNSLKTIWSITHKFEVIETEIVAGKKTEVPKEYQFVFYLDKKMKIKGAEGFYTD